MGFPVFWNDQRMEAVRMQKEGDRFTAIVRLPKDSLVRYRYQHPEKSYDDREQYMQNFEVNRMVHVTGAMEVSDRIYSWGPQTVPLPSRIFGTVRDASTGAPIIDAVIVADGIITYATGDGSYELNVRPGLKSIVVQLLDGSYKTQSINTDKEGELNFSLQKAASAKVTLKIQGNSLPQYNKARVYTSAEQTGARFLVGNIFHTAVFQTVDNTLLLNLYDGQHVDYLYTTGNPDIGYENKGGTQVVRSFVAKDGLVITDRLESFTNEETIVLNVRVPAYTNPAEAIGIGTLHPTLLLMHPKGNNEWTLTLSARRGTFAGRKYRYYKGYDGAGNESTLERTLSLTPATDVVTSWVHQKAAIAHQQYPLPAIKNRFEMFAFQADFYGSNMAVAMDRQLDNMREKGYHGIVLSQIWTYPRLEPSPRISRHELTTLYTPGYELIKLTKMAHDRGIKVSLFSQIVGAEIGLSQQKIYDSNWWSAWFLEQERFNMYNARIAEAAGMDYVFVGNRQPGLDMSEAYWSVYNAKMIEMIAKMRTVYKGKIIVRIDGTERQKLDYWKAGDILSHLAWDRLNVSRNPTQGEVDAAVANLLDTQYRPLQQAANKPFFIDGLAYFSIDDAANGAMVPESDGAYTDVNHNYPLNVEAQRMIHEAYYKAFNDRPWIAGVNLFGYGFTDSPEAREPDIRGKTAEDLASSWAKAISAR